jgi:hypothetical protein
LKPPAKVVWEHKSPPVADVSNIAMLETQTVPYPFMLNPKAMTLHPVLSIKITWTHVKN